jgi:O-antigen/teichoic acid export membrane protein
MKLGGTTSSFFQLVSANVVTKVTGLVAFGFFTRLLTTDELAFLPVYGMIQGLSHVLFGFGLQPTLIRRLPGLLESDRPSAGSLIRMSTRILMIGTATFALGVLLVAEPLAEKLLGSASHTLLIRLTAVGACCFAWRNICHYLLWSASYFDKIATVRAGAALGRAALGVAGLLVGGLKGLAIGLVINDALALVLSVIYSKDLLMIPVGPGLSHISLLKESLPFYFESYLTYLRNQGDNWIVATVLGPAAMGVYFVAMRFPMLLMMFVESFDKVVTTQLSKRRDTPDAISSSINDLLSPLVLVAVPGVFMMMGLLPVLIKVVAGPGFEVAILPGMILCLMQLVRIFAVPPSRGVFVTRTPITRVMITTVESASLIISLVVLVPLIAEPGVAISRLVAALAMLVASFVILNKRLHITFPWKPLAVSTSISTAMAATILAGIISVDNIMLSPVFAIAGVIVFLFLTWMFQAKEFFGALDQAVPFDVPTPLRRLMRLI